MPPLVFTICTNSHLAKAALLNKTLQDFCPDWTLTVGLVDQLDPRITYSDFVPEVLPVEELKIEGLNEMLSRYDAFEFSNAMKPFYLNHFLQRNSNEPIVYLDADTLLLSEIPLESILNGAVLSLTPHVFQPIPDDGLWPFENLLVWAGIYNLGFFCISPSEEAQKICDWWCSRLRYHCFRSYLPGVFVDQSWMSLAPLYFNSVSVIKDPGLNVGWWNIHERDPRKVDKHWEVTDGQPLRLFHYSGYDPNVPDQVSYLESTTHNFRCKFSKYHELVELYNYIGTELNEFSAALPQNLPWAFQRRSISERILGKLSRFFRGGRGQ